MKKINPAFFYLFVLVLLSHSSYAQTAAVDNSNPVPVLSTVNPPAVPVAPAAAQPTWTLDQLKAKIAEMSKSNPVKTEDAAPSTQLIELVPKDEYVTPSREFTSSKSKPKEDYALSRSELSKSGITASLKDGSAGLLGSAPKECAQRLVMDVKINDPVADEEESPSQISGPVDLSKQAKEVGIRVIFKADDQYKDLDACISDQRDQSMVNLSSLDKLNKSAVAPKDYARLGFMDSEGKMNFKPLIATPNYLKLSKAWDLANCADCKLPSKKLEEVMDSISGLPGDQSSLIAKLHEKGLDEVVSELDNARSLRDLTKIREQLVEYEHVIDRMKSDTDEHDRLMDVVTDAFRSLQMKTGLLAQSDRPRAGKYADFIASTGRTISVLPGLDKDFRLEQRLVASAYNKGGSMRLDFVSTIDPSNMEVRDFLGQEQVLLHNEQAQVTALCATKQARSNPNACQQAIAQMQATQARAESVATKFVNAQYAQQPAATPGTFLTGSSFGTPGSTPPTGGYVPTAARGLVNNTLTNNMYNLNPVGQGNIVIPQSSTQSMYTICQQSGCNLTTPNYAANANSLSQITNPSVPAIPLNGQLLPVNMQGLQPIQSQVPMYGLSN